MNTAGRPARAGHPHRALDELEAKQLLDGYGVPVVPEARVADVEAAAAAGRSLGYPVVLKGCGTWIELSIADTGVGHGRQCAYCAGRGRIATEGGEV